MNQRTLPSSWIFSLLILLVVSSETGAQTTITFENQGTGPTGAFLWPIYLPEKDPYLESHGNSSAGRPPGRQAYGGGLISGPGFTAELWAGPANSPEEKLIPIVATPFRTEKEAGLFVPVKASLSVRSGSTFTWQARVWDNRGGKITSWAAAEREATVIRAKSLLALAPAGSSTTHNGQSFNLHLDGRPFFSSHPQNLEAALGGQVGSRRTTRSIGGTTGSNNSEANLRAMDHCSCSKTRPYSSPGSPSRRPQIRNRVEVRIEPEGPGVG